MDHVNIRLAIALLCLLSLSQTASAVVLTQPDGLAAGDRYRFVFVTSDTDDAKSEDIDDYDDFVQDLAEAAGLGRAWRVIGSTGIGGNPVRADQHTDTEVGEDLDAAIFGVFGTLIANDYDDLWDESIRNGGIRINEKGDDVGSGKRVWTGTLSDGQSGGFLGALGGQNFLGSVVYGRTGKTDESWVEDDLAGEDKEYRFYAISDVRIATPEPSSIIIWTLAIAGAGFARSRFRKRKQPT